MKIHIYEKDLSLLKLYKDVLRVKGHEAQGFTKLYTCPCFSSGEHSCNSADQQPGAVIIDTRLISPDLEPLKYHAHKDCQCHSVRFAVIGTAFTDEQKECIERLGHFSLRKPFRLSELNDWLGSCVA